MRQPLRKPRQGTFRFALSDIALAIAAFTASGAVQAQTDKAAATPVATEGSSLSDMVVTEDALSSLVNESTGSSIGFTKPILETPRTVSFVSSEQLSLMGISSVDDLTRVVPGTFTTTRYGLQGGINVRGVAADMYFRGMKRINMQGHARTSLAAMDSIEVIKGPPSPIYGMGKIGGYSNLTPKSGRAKMGAYADKLTGFAQMVGGDYSKSEISAGAGGPINVLDRNGGFYIYGLVENSGSFVDKVGAQQRILQATFSLDNFLGPFRLETGTQIQNSITSGAYMNRATQSLIDRGVYISGQPLVNLDSGASLNGSLLGAGDGAVGFRETHANSPIRGNVSGGNRPLNQTFNWPTCSYGLCRPGDFPKIPGIPTLLYDAIQANPELAASPQGQAMLAAGRGGPKPGSATSSQQLPIGFALDPRTISLVPVNYHRNGSYERIQDAKLGLLFFDLVYDKNPDSTVKSQFFMDHLDSFKNSYLPYGEKQDIRLWEEKITFTQRIPDEILPQWLRVNSLASLNYRRTAGEIRSSGGDFDYRQDVMFRKGNHYPNTIFWNQLDNESFETGAPVTTARWSAFNEFGAGLMFDIDIFKNTNVVLGARYDRSRAKATDFRRFNENASNATTASYLPERTIHGWDGGKSWSFSISQKLPLGLRPYFTRAISSVSLDGANNIMVYDTVAAPGGHIGDATLVEYGLKAGWFNDRLFLTVANYKQTRTDISSAADPTASAEVSSTETKGTEVELKWNPDKHFSVQGYAVLQKAEYIVDQSGAYEFNGRDLGFQDVYDSAGNLVYPAEAFLYGGRVQMNIPADVLKGYRKRTGTPDKQASLNLNYNFDNGVGLMFGGTWFSSVYADRLQRMKLPQSTTANAAMTYDWRKWQFKLNAYNLFDEIYFRARNSDTGTNLVSVMPGRRLEFTLKMDF